MRKQAKHTPKKVAKKSAAKQVNEVPAPEPVMDQCCGPNLDYHRGRQEAMEEHLRELEGDPWIQYNLHAENVRDINARLDELDSQKKRLMSRLSGEVARRDAFRQLVIDLAQQ